MKKIIFLKALLVTIFIFFGHSLVYADSWVAPPENPPSFNTAAPLDVSDNPQAKAGRLVVGYDNATQLTETLEVVDISDGTARIRIADNAQNPEIQLQYNNPITNPNDHWAIYVDQSDKKLIFWRLDDLVTFDQIGTNPVEVRVGIQTDSPVATLHLNGGVGTLSKGIVFNNGGTGIFESADDNLSFNTANTRRLEIGDAGQVKVGYTLTSDPLNGYEAGDFNAKRLCINGDCQSIWPGGGMSYPTEMMETNIMNTADFKAFSARNGWEGLKGFASLYGCPAIQGWHVCNSWEMMAYMDMDNLDTSGCTTRIESLPPEVDAAGVFTFLTNSTIFLRYAA